MKEEMLHYLNDRIAWHQREQSRLKAEYRQDEAVHMQIAGNVYTIFLATYQAMKYDLRETTARFRSILRNWEESHQRACDHGDESKRLIEEIKLAQAAEIFRHADEMEAMA